MRYLALVLLLVSVPALAQESVQLQACMDKARSQKAMNRCAGEEVTRVESELNGVYHKLLLAAASEPGAVAKIKSAENAWIAYRNAYEEAMYPAEDKQAEYGSRYPMDADFLRAELTRRQIPALKELLKQYK
jgi:uncharacterized protein YecT (DUF1311 family)